MGMKQILVIMAAVVLVGCGKDTPETSQAAEAEAQVEPASTPEPDPVPSAEEKIISISNPIVERAVRESLNNLTGELTEAELAKVTSLMLNSTQITDEGLKEVAMFQQLTLLGLGTTKITNAGLKEVAKLQNLDMLDLRGTKVTDAGLKHVAKLKKLGLLRLNNTKATAAGVAELEKALPNCQIVGP